MEVKVLGAYVVSYQDRKYVRLANGDWYLVGEHGSLELVDWAFNPDNTDLESEFIEAVLEV